MSAYTIKNQMGVRKVQKHNRIELRKSGSFTTADTNLSVIAYKGKKNKPAIAATGSARIANNAVYTGKDSLNKSSLISIF